MKATGRDSKVQDDLSRHYADMANAPAQADRLRHVCSVASIQPISPPQRVESHSNDAWVVDDRDLGQAVLRICWRGDVNRLIREATVARRMPEEIRYPEVLGSGLTALDGFPLSYSMTRRLDGASLAHSWDPLDTATARGAVAQLAAMLRELHRWTPPADLADVLVARTGLGEGIDGLLGADITPLPTERALFLAERGEGLPYVDPGLMSDAAQAIEEYRHLEPAMDDPARHGLIHGDVHLENLWWSDSRVGVLDLEWVRFAPPLLDIQRLCERADDDVVNGADRHPAILRWLESGYPELFRTRDAAKRMVLYSLAYTIRHLIVAPPDRPADALPPEHSVHRLRRLVDGRWPAPGALPESLTD